MSETAFARPFTTDPPLALGEAEIPVETHVHANKPNGPSEMICKACGLSMLPLWVYSSRHAIDAGMERWACIPCWRSVLCTWKLEA